MRSVTSTACCIILSRSSQAFTRCLLSANVSGLPAPNFLQPLEGLTLALFRCWFAPRFLLPACLPNCSSAALLCHSSLFFRISFKVFQGLSNIRTAVRWNSAGLAALSLIFVSSSAMAAFVPALSSTRLCLCRVFLCKLFFFILKPATRLFSGCESLGLPGVPRRAARSSIACCSSFRCQDNELLSFSSGFLQLAACPLVLQNSLQNSGRWWCCRILHLEKSSKSLLLDTLLLLFLLHPSKMIVLPKEITN